ncbi:MAG: argininosuccinate lyase [Dehalococcoidales bacterium]|nr:argininosuccinate lyase [Dehalococcoidales bacterium]
MSHIRGRFHKDADESVVKYTASIPFDWRLYRHDIAGSIAHVRMLARQGIILEKETEVIVQGLIAIGEEIEQGKFQFKPELDDVHMNIESRLVEMIGEVGGKLHTARSRNDQVALDLRLFAKEAISNTLVRLREFQQALISLAEVNKSVIMPGYTHLQPAQPVFLAHHLLAYFEMLQRDIDRFNDCLKRTDVMPLGSGALAGVTYKIDRDFLARELGFSQISNNSMDAVSDRDFVVEYEAAASLCMMHLSRLAEEIILWSSAEFDFIELDEAYATGSSIMPQKKNPDVAELVRGKTGRVYGRLVALLTMMKALPLAYNRDMQEDKEGFFDTVDTLLVTLEVFTGMVKTLWIKAENIGLRVKQGYILATDLADYLVKKGEPFRNSHHIVARLVSYAAEKGKLLSEISLADYQEFSPLFDEDIYSVTAESSIAARDVTGGTAPGQVDRALTAAKKIIREFRSGK